MAAGGTHVIARGDTLWDIAKAAYGDGTLWRRIAEANGNPRPRALHVGTELSIPTNSGQFVSTISAGPGFPGPAFLFRTILSRPGLRPPMQDD